MAASGGAWSFSFTEKDVVEGGAATVLHYDYEKELQHKKKAHQCILCLAPIHKPELILDLG